MNTPSTTASTRRTLADLNAGLAARISIDSEWGKYTLRTSYAVGAQSQVSSSSPKTHVLRVKTVIEDRDPQPRTYKVGDRFQVTAWCNSNGQHTGRVYEGLDTDRVTCTKCAKSL